MPDPVIQRRLAKKIVSQNWSVRETERRVKYTDQKSTPRASKSATHYQDDPNIRAAETKLRRVLATQVKIVPGSPGRIEIEYYDLSDLDRIFTVITRNTELTVQAGR